jgi:hypothetical protein
MSGAIRSAESRVAKDFCSPFSEPVVYTIRMRYWAAILLLPIALSARADVYLLADGTRCEGVSVENGDQLTITTFDGKTIHIAKKDLRGSVPEPKRNEYFKRLKALTNDDVAGRVELGLFCQKNNLKAQATALFEAALKIDPTSADAGNALGYVLKDGAWRPAVDEAIQIGVRPPPKIPEATQDQVRSLQKRLEQTPIDAAGNPNADVTELISSARANPSVLAKIMLPPQFVGAFSGIKPEVRTRAARLAGMTQDRRVMQALVDASIYDPDENTRFAAAKALPLLEEPVAIRKLLDIATSGDTQHHPWILRKMACIALRRYGSQEVLERLMKELSFELAGGNPYDPKNSMRGKGRGLGSDNPLGVQDNILPAYGVPDTDLYPVLTAMKEITGKTFDSGEKDMKTWIAWWKIDGQKFVFKD